ncbi:MAG: hypothetical protein ACFWTJ_13765 [Lachnoclostridium sp.]|jgi:lysophospholipase L1-like esterase
MKRKGKRIWSLIFCVVMAITMVSGNTLLVNASDAKTIGSDKKNKADDTAINYVALGDSIAAGYGLPGYRAGTTPEKAYVSIVGNALGGRMVNLAKDGLTSLKLLETLDTLRPSQSEYLSQANIITLSIGSNDLLKPFMGIIAEKLACDVSEIQTKLAELKANNNQLALLRIMAELNADDGTGLKNNPDLKNAADAFAVNFRKIIARIKELAPNARIIVTNAYNPYEGINLNYVLGTLKLGEITDIYIQELNKAFTANSADYTLIDVYAAFSDSFKNGVSPVNANLSAFNFDPHPNVVGHSLIAKEILKPYAIAVMPIKTIIQGILHSLGKRNP